jgi:hypothetical protein
MKLLGDTAMSIPDLITQAALHNGVDPQLALEVAQAESGLNPNAISGAGAIGVMQLEPATAAIYGADPYNTAENIDAGVSYLGDLLNQFGDAGTALAAYNWGPGAVRRAIATYGTAPVGFRGGAAPAWFAHAPSETQNYVLRILGNMAFAGLPSPPPGAGVSSPALPAVPPVLPSTAGASGGLLQTPYASLLPPVIAGPAGNGNAFPWVLVALAGGFVILLLVAN